VKVVVLNDKVVHAPAKRATPPGSVLVPQFTNTLPAAADFHADNVAVGAKVDPVIRKEFLFTLPIHC
jgi:hypothetical protein